MEVSKKTNHYIILTIGPIIDTIRRARRCRELWAASYFFSYFMKRVLQKLYEVQNEYRILLPVLHERDLLEGVGIKTATGLYSDRLMVLLREDVVVDSTNANDLYRGFINILVEVLKDTGIKDHRKAFENYLQLYSALVPVSEDELAKENTWIVEYLNNLMDTMECAKLANPFDFNDFRREIFENANTNFLAQDGIPADDWENNENGMKSARFPSIAEIACEEIIQKDQSKFKSIAANFVRGIVKTEETLEWAVLDDYVKEDFYVALNEDATFKNVLKQRHKYYAIVQGDGDGVGQFISSLKNDVSNINEFSKTLLSFGIDASVAIKDAGARAVFLGGDDILFFCSSKHKK